MIMLENFFAASHMVFKYLRVGEFNSRVVDAVSHAQGIILYGDPDSEFIKSLMMLHVPVILCGKNTKSAQAYNLSIPRAGGLSERTGVAPFKSTEKGGQIQITGELIPGGMLLFKQDK